MYVMKSEGSMRKLHKVMIAAAAAGGLTAIGAGTSVAHDATARRDRFEIAAEIEQDERP